MVRVTQDYIPRNIETVRSASVDEDRAAEIQDFQPAGGFAAETIEQQQNEFTRVVTNSSTKDDKGAVGRFTELVTKLSEKKNKNEVLKIDPNDFDFQRILKNYLRSANEQGIRLRSAGVVFKDVSTVGVDSANSYVKNSLDIFKLPIDFIKSLPVLKNVGRKRKIIRNVTGVVQPGEMCLVLGKPGAGCSTLLKTIAAEHSQFIRVEGDIHYDGISQEEMIKKYKSDIIYNGELDVHYPHLTVDQTLRFVLGCKTPHTRIYNTSRENFVTAERDMLGTIFGLTHTYDTKVGDDYIRGVSGGERKRVSIAEAMACKATVYCWDNATRGLDASTALEYANAIRTSTSLTNSVTLVTIYQAGENIYNNFDKVLVLSEGHQIFFGKVETARQYFIDMGFESAPRQDTAEFLTCITDPKGRVPRKGYENRVPRTNEEFEAYWRNSPQYQELLNEIEEYESAQVAERTRENYDQSLKQERMRSYSKYTVGFFFQLKLLIIRGFQRIWGDRIYTIIEFIASTIQALVLGSLYWNTPDSTSGAFSRGGILFFALLHFSLIGLSEIAGQFSERPIVLKQKSYFLFHPGAETIASLLSKLPFKIITILCFYIPFYFLTNLRREAGKFFLNLFLLIVTSQCITALFEMVASLCTSYTIANSIAGVFVIIIVTYNGYLIQLNSMHHWFKWLNYVNPVRWAYESMLAVEFHGRQMACGTPLVPSGPGYADVTLENQVCPFVGSEKGQFYVSGDSYIAAQYSYHYSHVYRNLGFVIAYFVVFVTITAIATEFKSPTKGGGDHLYYRRSTKVPGGVFMQHHVKQTSDVESGDQTIVNEGDDELKEAQEEVFDSLGSTGVFTWQNINYMIPTGKTTRKLLDSVDGYVKPGTLTALMGESGAGKTTLLNVLSQRIDFGTITGDFLVNGKPLDATFNRSTGYVQQQDLHLAELTVRESLYFAARLRRPKSVPDSEKLDYAEQIITILGMQSYAEAVVGELGAGLNVEQRKKLSIGVELVAKPSLLLFLDEPTSGLDSQSSSSIIKLLRKLASSGQSILCTIHQPSATLFESFDRLLLLKKGGRTVYFGDIGDNSHTILSYFEYNGARKSDPKENPAEYILEAIGAGATATVQQDWGEVWAKSPESQATTKEIQRLVSEGSSNAKQMEHHSSDPQIEKELKSTYAMPYWDQLKFVIKRTSKIYWRDNEYILSKVILLIFGGLIIGFTYYNIQDSIVGIQNTIFAVFLALVITAACMNQIEARALPARELYEVRESKSNTFHWSTIIIAQYVNELPYHLVLGTAFWGAFYFPLRIFYQASRSGVWFLHYVIMFQMFYLSFGLLIVYMSPDLPSASVLSSIILAFLISFCGVVQPLRSMPGFWTFMFKASPYTYFVQSLCALLVHEKPVRCDPIELSYFDPPSGQTCQEYAGPFVQASTGYINNPGSSSNCGYCQFTVGDEFLATVSIKYSYVWRNFGFYFAYILFNIFAMCFLYWFFRVYKFSPMKYVSGFIGRFKKAGKHHEDEEQ
ncbi:hypothetical protein WICPIJ_009448 [Wickerhamomyces pijperi]|uniref:ABC transporter domain-containing protein n=1 Tax=Wickerhamomyces pijperi TaxID=599730 RepID=A0A9P8PM91_WICPI|nr:hypothetical protein WICPIJ_009448 [Wickerhamomyces pijperi]